MYYNGEHSVTFGEKNTWDDWHLIPSSRPVFNPPEFKSNYVDIPGGYGVLDLSEALTGYPLYGNRTGSMEFIVANGYLRWEEAYSNIANYLHGQFLKAVLEDDKGFYYEGRFTVNQWKSDEHWSTITIDYDVFPFKMELTTSAEKWLWDPFNFETGIIRNYSELKVSGTLNLTIPGRSMFVSPEITVDSDDGSGMNVQINGETYHLTDGLNVVPNISFGSGNTVLKFTGKGTVTVNYRGGSL